MKVKRKMSRTEPVSFKRPDGGSGSLKSWKPRSFETHTLRSARTSGKSKATKYQPHQPFGRTRDDSVLLTPDDLEKVDAMIKAGINAKIAKTTIAASGTFSGEVMRWYVKKMKVQAIQAPRKESRKCMGRPTRVDGGDMRATIMQAIQDPPKTPIAASSVLIWASDIWAPDRIKGSQRLHEMA